jgi:hypothetical protein
MLVAIGWLGRRSSVPSPEGRDLRMSLGGEIISL